MKRIPTDIDKRIAYEVGRQRLRRFAVFYEDVLAYRFVDVYRAIERYCETRGAVLKIESTR